MGRVIYTEHALDDLRKIQAYIAQDNPEAARRMLKRIDERCWLLAENPSSGTSASELAEGLRAVSVGSYVIFYLSLLDESGVRVVRVLHGARDLPVAINEGE